MQQALSAGPDAGPTRKHRMGEREVELPCLVREQTTMSAFFRAPSREARKLLPSQRLKLVEIFPGQTLVGFACMDYRKVDGLADYTEVGIMVPVRYAPRFDVPVLPIVAPQLFKQAGYYFHRMVVSSPEAFALGVEVHGLRKLLGEVTFEDLPFARRCRARVEGKSIFELEVRHTPARTMKMTTHTFTMQGAHVLKTPVPTQGEMGFGHGEKAAKLTLGDSYVADELRALKLSHDALFTLWAPRVESVLAAPSRTLLG